MHHYWITKNNGSSCILFLAGWGMAPEPFKSVPVAEHDLLMVYDYRRIDPQEIIEITRDYTTVHLLAWSMGVWIAGAFFDTYSRNFTTATAVNGTLQPINDQFGIPPELFDEMIRNFSPLTLDQFYRDMFEQPNQAERFLDRRPHRPLDSVLSELEILQNMYNRIGPGKNLFTRRIVCSRDRIFPARSQLRSWGKEHCRLIKAAHFPFYERTFCELVTGKS